MVAADEALALWRGRPFTEADDVAADVEGNLDRCGDLVAEGYKVGCGAEGGEDYRKLVTANSGDKILAAHGLLQPFRNGAKEFVACAVAQRIV